MTTGSLTQDDEMVFIEPIPDHRLYGLIAEFGDPETILQATRRAFMDGYRQMDAFTPFPVEGLSDALKPRHDWLLPFIILGGGLSGFLGGFAMQWFASVIDYPLNIGGRPFNSWPAYIPIAFELAILTAAFAAILGLFALNGLPQPYHPVFNAQNFELASRNRFFLAIERADPRFDREQTRQFLESLNPIQVSEVEL